MRWKGAVWSVYFLERSTRWENYLTVSLEWDLRYTCCKEYSSLFTVTGAKVLEATLLEKRYLKLYL